MNDHLLKISWPVARLGEALEALARRSGLAIDPLTLSRQPRDLEGDNEALGRWIEDVARGMNLEAKPYFCSYDELEGMVKTAGPALLRLRTKSGLRFLALFRSNRQAVYILDPKLAVHRVRPSVVCAALRSELEAPFAAQVETLLTKIGVSKRKRANARRAILRERLSAVSIDGGWLLHLSPGAKFTGQLRRANVLYDTIVLAAAHAFQYSLWLLAWWVVGRLVLEGRVDYGWLAAWVLLLLTLVPLRLFTTWKLGTLAIKAGGLLKQRLLYGALRMEPDETRRDGTGQLLGRIIETDALESLALSGGFLSLLAAIELCFATWVLGNGSVGWKHSLLLIVWLAAALLIGWVYFKKRRHWMKKRLRITNDLVERMVGHRTRLAQERREHWHAAEDQALELYHLTAQRMDGMSVLLSSVVARGWLLVGIAAVALSFIYSSTSQGRLAVALGGVILAWAALRRLVAGLTQLADAAIAWRQVAPVLEAAAQPQSSSISFLADVRTSEAQPLKVGDTIMDARDLVFSYRDRAEAVIKGSSLRIRTGDKILLEGPSGGGKSTLAALLVGLRIPDSGLLLLRGLDRQTLGDENWRRMVVSAPQFHENYVMAETFAFNLLMGRRWPPRPEEMEEAEAVCRELGLGELIDRMPAGMLQMVGETGWQLSHGERSRLYIARAILQHPDIAVLDESFAALDPENLRRALTCVLNRAETVLVIAHP